MKELTGFTDAQVIEVLEACKDTLKPVGPGRRYRDMESGLITYLVWLTSGWTVTKIGCLFDAAKATVQRTLAYVMSGLTESLKLAYLPKSVRDINISPQFKNFPQAIGAVDAASIPSRNPLTERMRVCITRGGTTSMGQKSRLLLAPMVLPHMFRRPFQGADMTHFLSEYQGLTVS